jgi:glucose/arabinose dehydrogenase
MRMRSVILVQFVSLTVPSPRIAAGLKVEALATGLEHPRSLPFCRTAMIAVGADQPAQGPGDEMDRITGTSAGGNQKSNRITLVRQASEENGPQVRSVLLDNLNSPFGAVLFGNDLYVANTDAIVRYPYKPGDTKISAGGSILTPLPCGLSIIIGPRASSPAATALSFMSGW